MLAVSVSRARARGEIAGAEPGPVALAAGPAILRDRFLFHDLAGLRVDNLVDAVILPPLDPRAGRAR